MIGLKHVFKGYADAGTIIKKSNLRIFYFIPGLIAILLLGAFYYVSTKLSFSLFNMIGNMINIENYHQIAFYLIKALVFIIVFLVYFLIYKGLILILLSPILSYISEKVEENITGEKFEITFSKNVKLALRGAIVSGKYFMFELLGTLLILGLGMVPVFNIASPFLLLLLQGFFVGASMMDYTLERQNMGYKDSFAFVRRYPLFSIVNGIFFILFMMVPVIGIFMAPLVSCVAVTKGTLGIIKEKNEKENPQSSEKV